VPYRPFAGAASALELEFIENAGALERGELEHGLAGRLVEVLIDEGADRGDMLDGQITASV
jgi:hypothetical protein